MPEKPLDLATRLIAEHISAVAPSVRNVRQAFAYTISVPFSHSTAIVEAVRLDGTREHVILAVVVGPLAWSIPETPAQRAIHEEIAGWLRENRAAINLAIDAANERTVTDWLERYDGPEWTADDGTNNDSLDADFRDSREN